MKSLFITLISCVLFVLNSYAQGQTKTFLFVGSYTEGEIDTGIYIFEFDTITGVLTQKALVDDIVNPSFINLSSNGQYLYACTETKQNRDGSITAFSINPELVTLERLNKKSTNGRNPVHASIHQSDQYIVVSNYTDGGLQLYDLHQDGSIDQNTQDIQFNYIGSEIIAKRQDVAHIHAAIFSPDGKYLFATDLGADKIYSYKLKKNGQLKARKAYTISTTAGSGPRHFIFHPNGQYAYCIEELSGTVTSYSYKKGKLTCIDTDFSYSKEQESYGSSDIHISPDGRFLYASNRWYDENTISIFEINKNDGTLNFIAHQPTLGDHPRSFVLSPNGNFLIVANQATGNIVVFIRDQVTGLLSKIGDEVYVELPSSLKMYEYTDW